MINSESVKHVLYFNGFLSDSITDYIILLVWCCVLKPIDKALKGEEKSAVLGEKPSTNIDSKGKFR